MGSFSGGANLDDVKLLHIVEFGLLIVRYNWFTRLLQLLLLAQRANIAEFNGMAYLNVRNNIPESRKATSDLRGIARSLSGIPSLSQGFV